MKDSKCIYHLKRERKAIAATYEVVEETYKRVNYANHLVRYTRFHANQKDEKPACSEALLRHVRCELLVKNIN